MRFDLKCFSSPGTKKKPVKISSKEATEVLNKLDVSFSYTVEISVYLFGEYWRVLFEDFNFVLYWGWGGAQRLEKAVICNW